MRTGLRLCVVQRVQNPLDLDAVRRERQHRGPRAVVVRASPCTIPGILAALPEELIHPVGAQAFFHPVRAEVVEDRLAYPRDERGVQATGVGIHERGDRRVPGEGQGEHDLDGAAAAFRPGLRENLRRPLVVAEERHVPRKESAAEVGHGRDVNRVLVSVDVERDIETPLRRVVALGRQVLEVEQDVAFHNRFELRLQLFVGMGLAGETGHRQRRRDARRIGRGLQHVALVDEPGVIADERRPADGHHRDRGRSDCGRPGARIANEQPHGCERKTLHVQTLAAVARDRAAGRGASSAPPVRATSRAMATVVCAPSRSA